METKTTRNDLMVLFNGRVILNKPSQRMELTPGVDDARLSEKGVPNPNVQGAPWVCQTCKTVRLALRLINNGRNCVKCGAGRHLASENYNKPPQWNQRSYTDRFDDATKATRIPVKRTEPIPRNDAERGLWEADSAAKPSRDRIEAEYRAEEATAESPLALARIRNSRRAAADGWGFRTLREEAADLAALDRTLAEHSAVVASIDNEVDRASVEAELRESRARWVVPYEARRQAATEVGLRQLGGVGAARAVTAVNLENIHDDAGTYYVSLVKACVTALKSRDGTGSAAFKENGYDQHGPEGLYDILRGGYKQESRVLCKVPEHALTRDVHSRTIVGVLRLLLIDLSPPLLSGVSQALAKESSAAETGMDAKQTLRVVRDIRMSAKRVSVLKEILTLAIDLNEQGPRADSTAIMLSLGSAMVFGNNNPLGHHDAHTRKIERFVRALSVHASIVMRLL
jgi:hypothetical protein